MDENKNGSGLCEILNFQAKLRSGLSSVKPKYIADFFVILIALSILLGYVSLIGEDVGEGISEFYFGVDAAYADIDEITELINQVSA